jgi:hypothetical protein
MHTWELFWYKTGLAIGGVLVTGRTVVHRLPFLPIDPHRRRPRVHVST